MTESLTRQRAFRERQKRQISDLQAEIEALKDANAKLRAQLEDVHRGMGTLQRGITEHLESK